MKTIEKVFLIILFLAPFFQGLYFYHEVFFVTILMLLILICLVFLHKKLVIYKSINTLIIGFIVLLYFGTSSYAVDSGMALLGSLKMLAVFILYLLYAQIYSETLKEKALVTLAYSCGAISILSIMAYFTGFYYDYLVQNERLGGSFQYANTFGLFCLINLVILIRKKTRHIVDYILMISITCGLMLTFSRSIIFLALVTILTIIIIQYKHKKKFVAVGIFLIALGVFGGIVYQGDLVKSALRLKEVFNAGEWQIRLLYYTDGLKILKAFPFGTGYLGYYYVQRFFQTGSTYYIKYIHSSLYQITLDISIVGGLLFLGLFAVNILNRRLDKLSKVMLLVILIHSLIDFDFEFSLMYFIVFLIIGFDDHQSLYISYKKGWQMAVLTVVTLIYSYMFTATFLMYNNQYEKAYALYPLYTDAKIKKVTNDHKYTIEDFRLCEELTNSNEYLVEAFAYQRDYYYNSGDYEKAMETAEKVMQLNPINIKHVEHYSDILLAYTKWQVSNGLYEEANITNDKVLGLPEYLTELAKNRNTDYNVIHKPNLVMTRTLRDNYEEACNIKIQMENMMDF
jgi:tetratricopeptide (TPR) repeat protein